MSTARRFNKTEAANEIVWINVCSYYRGSTVYISRENTVLSINIVAWHNHNEPLAVALHYFRAERDLRAVTYFLVQNDSVNSMQHGRKYASALVLLQYPDRRVLYDTPFPRIDDGTFRVNVL
jgi:hypothetical protein